MFRKVMCLRLSAFIMLMAVTSLAEPPSQPQLQPGDSDGDGIRDDRDNCPNVAGPMQLFGCPETKMVVTSTRIEVKQRIQFAFGTVNVLPKSFPSMDEVVATLTERQRLCLRIEGHTDQREPTAQAQQLSEGRARAVKEYLVKQGINANRLLTKGYGAQLPLEDNGSQEGREANRRAEFVVVPCPGK